MKHLKITVIGAGSTYTPELVDGLIRRKEELPLETLCLMDIDRRKLTILGNMTRRMLEANGLKCKVVLTEDLTEAVRNADFVLCQIRVGRLDARVKDEKIPLKYGLIGQETTGIGGFMKAMRTIPVMMEIAGCMERYCPEAWMINFTNPSGIIAETLLNHTGIRMIGLCNSPFNMKKEVVEGIAGNVSEVWVDFAGLNHLLWITGIYCDGREVLKDHLFGRMVSFMKNIHPVEIDETLLSSIGAIPSPYLTYYYYRDRQLTELEKEPLSRGEVCIRIEEELLELYSDPGLKEKPAILGKRGGSHYSDVAISVLSAIHNDRNEIHVVDVKNEGALDFMGKEDVVEINCKIGKNGAVPVPLKNFDNLHIQGLMQTVKAYEKLAVRAGLEGNYADALNALLLHPLAGDYDRTKGALDELLEAHKPYLPQFFKG